MLFAAPLLSGYCAVVQEGGCAHGHAVALASLFRFIMYEAGAAIFAVGERPRHSDDGERGDLRRNEDEVSIRSRAHASRLAYARVLAKCGAAGWVCDVVTLSTRNARCDVLWVGPYISKIAWSIAYAVSVHQNAQHAGRAAHRKCSEGDVILRGWSVGPTMFLS